MFQNSKVASNKNVHNFWLFYGTVFLAFSDGVIYFVPSVSRRNRFLSDRISPTANQKPLSMWFLKLTLPTKWIIPWERAWKTVPENGFRSCVHFCLKSLLHLERCVEIKVKSKRDSNEWRVILSRCLLPMTRTQFVSTANPRRAPSTRNRLALLPH